MPANLSCRPGGTHFTERNISTRATTCTGGRHVHHFRGTSAFNFMVLICLDLTRLAAQVTDRTNATAVPIQPTSIKGPNGRAIGNSLHASFLGQMSLRRPSNWQFRQLTTVGGLDCSIRSGMSFVPPLLERSHAYAKAQGGAWTKPRQPNRGKASVYLHYPSRRSHLVAGSQGPVVPVSPRLRRNRRAAPRQAPSGLFFN